MAGSSLEGWRIRRGTGRPLRPPRAVVEGDDPLAGEVARRIAGAGIAVTDGLDRPADVVVLCPGAEHAPAAALVRATAARAARACPTTAIIVASPEALPLCREAARASGLPPWLILGTGGVPLAAAEAARLAARLGVSPGQVEVPVIGGDPRGPCAGLRVLGRYAAVAGIPAAEIQYLRDEDLPARRADPPAGAGQAAAAAALARAVLHDTRRVHCCAGWVEGSHGLPGAFVTLPFPVGARGAETPLALRLSLEERALLQRVAGEGVRG